jgi:hypothetical protein
VQGFSCGLQTSDYQPDQLPFIFSIPAVLSSFMKFMNNRSTPLTAMKKNATDTEKGAKAPFPVASHFVNPGQGPVREEYGAIHQIPAAAGPVHRNHR